jgi:hypothetical protein
LVGNTEWSSREEEMTVLTGNIYLLDLTNNRIKKLIENEVIGYDVSLKQLHDYYLVDVLYGKDGNSELYLYDKNFNLMQYFVNLQHYELIFQP